MHAFEKAPRMRHGQTMPVHATAGARASETSQTALRVVSGLKQQCLLAKRYPEPRANQRLTQTPKLPMLQRQRPAILNSLSAGHVIT